MKLLSVLMICVYIFFKTVQSVFSWVCSTNHKDIGMLYMILAVVGSGMGTIWSMLIRMELCYPHEYFFMGNHQGYNMVVTVHAIVMMFFTVMPGLIGGFGNMLLPMMCGVSEMAFPRMNNLSFWLLVVSFGFFHTSLLVDEYGVLGVGWTLYPPLSDVVVSASFAMEQLIFSLHIAGLSSILGALNFVATYFYPASSDLSKLSGYPLFCYSMIVTAFLLMLSLPVLAAALTMLITDRNFGTAFFVYSGGGDPLMYQHLFWFFGHPEVYVLVLPAFGVISDVVSFYSSSSPFGKVAMVWSLKSIGFMGMMVWGHHMFTVGMETDVKLYFMVATMMIAMPTGMKVFGWVLTIFSGRMYLSDALCWAVSFMMLFTFGGFTGFMLSNAVIDMELHDTYFVVAHFHYVLSMGAVFGLMAGLYHWYPFWVGKPFPLFYSRMHFMATVVGANVTFFPMHMLGFVGLPSSCPVFIDDAWFYHSVCTYGSFISLLSFYLMFLLVVQFLSMDVVSVYIGLSSGDKWYNEKEKDFFYWRKSLSFEKNFSKFGLSHYRLLMSLSKFLVGSKDMFLLSSFYMFSSNSLRSLNMFEKGWLDYQSFMGVPKNKLLSWKNFWEKQIKDLYGVFLSFYVMRRVLCHTRSESHSSWKSMSYNHLDSNSVSKTSLVLNSYFLINLFNKFGTYFGGMFQGLKMYRGLGNLLEIRNVKLNDFVVEGDMGVLNQILLDSKNKLVIYMRSFIFMKEEDFMKLDKYGEKIVSSKSGFDPFKGEKKSVEERKKKSVFGFLFFNM